MFVTVHWRFVRFEISLLIKNMSPWIVYIYITYILYIIYIYIYIYILGQSVNQPKKHCSIPHGVMLCLREMCLPMQQQLGQEAATRVFCKKWFCKFHRKTCVLNLSCNFIKKQLQHRCFCVKFVTFLRIPILEKICKWLLLWGVCFAK